MFSCYRFPGKGTQVWKKPGAIYNGEWKYDKRDGYGTYSVLLPDKKEYIKKYCGEWKTGKKHVCIWHAVILKHTYAYSHILQYFLFLGVWDVLLQKLSSL